ncbi:MAG TPA: heavy metal-binding domain-containing protein [Streptosporangiaceae bacterium]
MTPSIGRGELPDVAKARVAAIKASGTWDSALSTGEFAAIKSVGFEPAGQVFGAAVYRVGSPGGTICPTYGREWLTAGAGARQPEVLSTGRDVFGPLVRVGYEARSAAIARMSNECSALGGHGVVGMSVTADQLDGRLECTATGTAIRAPGPARMSAGPRLKTPFTTVVTGQEFAKLIMAGFVPVSVVFGISIGVNHDDWLRSKLFRGLARKLADNVEVSAYTDLVNLTRQDARRELQRHVARAGGRGVVIQRMDLRIGEYDCPGLTGDRDRWAEAIISGTAIVELTAHRRRDRHDRQAERRRERQAEQRQTLPVVSMDPERRQGAKVSAPAPTAEPYGPQLRHL